MKLYISGPMSGIKDYNFPAFNAAADALCAAGYEIENPADKGLIDGWEWADYLRYDVAKLVACDGIALLDGWMTSKGARLEYQLARDLGMPARLLVGWIDASEDGYAPPFGSSAYVRGLRVLA